MTLGLGSRRDEVAVQALGLVLEPLGHEAKPGNLGARANLHVGGVILTGDSHRVGHGETCAVVAVLADQRPVRAATGAGLVLERQP